MDVIHHEPVLIMNSLLRLTSAPTAYFRIGTLAYVNAVPAYFSLQSAVGQTVDGSSVIASSSGRVWVKMLTANVAGGGGGGGGSVTPTTLNGPATLTAAQTLVFADTSGGSFTLTLPSNPTNGMTFEFDDVTNSFATNKLTVAAGAGQSIRNVALGAGNYAASTDLTVEGGVYVFRYDGGVGRTRWNLQ